MENTTIYLIRHAETIEKIETRNTDETQQEINKNLNHEYKEKELST